MKTPSDELFLLLRSMSKQEKRYFRIYAETFSGTQRNYIRLFSAIDKQRKAYDEKKIKELFKKDIAMVDHLPSIKKQLYRLVLKSLENYHRDSSINMELSDALKNIEILFNKALYSQCFKALIRTKKTAYMHEQFEQVLSLLKWERLLADVDLQVRRDIIDIEKINREESNVLELMDNMRLYRILSKRMYQLFTGSGMIRDRKVQVQFKKFRADPLLADISNALTVYSRLSFYYAHSFYFFLTGDTKRGIEQLERRLALLENTPTLLKVYSDMYISTLSNMLNIFLGDRKYYKQFFVVLQKLRSAPVRSKAMQIKLFETTYPRELGMYLKVGDLDKARKAVNIVEAGILQYDEMLNKNHRPVLFFIVACVYFVAKEYKASRKWINTILEFDDKLTRPDIQCMARILNLIVYFEQNEDVSPEHYIRATYRFLTKESRLYKVENIFLNFISNTSPDSNGPYEQVQAFKELRKQLIGLSKNKFETQAFAYFDFVSWVDSKIEGRPFADVLRGKARQSTNNE